MEKFGPYYIGKVSLSSLRGWILDSGLTQADTVLLHPETMAEVMEEYRELYREAMPDPYFLLGVLLEESNEVRVPENRVLALRGDERVGRPEYQPGPPVFKDDGREVFRCTHCGQFVNEHGEVLSGQEHSYSLALLRHRNEGATRHRRAECCRNK